MASSDTKALIEESVQNFQRNVPALAKLKLVVELELRGRGDIQHYRVELPGPKVSREVAADARIRLEVPRARFNDLARDGSVRAWRAAFADGTAKANGPSEILKLVSTVVARQEERDRTRKRAT